MTRHAFAGLVLALWFFSNGAWAASYAVPRSVPQNQAAAEILDEVVIAKQPGRYIGWPDIVRAANGDLLIAFSGDRDWHVDPWGKIFTVRSTDGGESWNEPIVRVDTPLDDRGSSLVVLPDESILLTFGTSLVFDDPDSERYAPYQPYAESLSKEVRRKWKGHWMRRSEDDGRTWGESFVSVPGRVPHGPTLLDDGRLLLVRPTVYESTDGGVTWSKIGEIEKPATWTSDNAFLSELHAVQAADGRIVALSRYHDKDAGDMELRQLVSKDGGRTWSKPRKTGMEGYPPHLLRLNNGWLLAVYGRRAEPMGQRACISKDNGETWLTDQEIVLSNAVPRSDEKLGYPSGWDLGYPSSVQLPDGSIWTVYYQVEKVEDGKHPSLMGTHWRLKGLDERAKAPSVPGATEAAEIHTGTSDAPEG